MDRIPLDSAGIPGFHRILAGISGGMKSTVGFVTGNGGCRCCCGCIVDGWRAVVVDVLWMVVVMLEYCILGMLYSIP
jgi:hypothetical protein